MRTAQEIAYDEGYAQAAERLRAASAVIARLSRIEVAARAVAQEWDEYNARWNAHAVLIDAVDALKKALDD